VASLILAIRFLTIVPAGRAAWWFPAVGFGLGTGLVLVDRLLACAFPPLLAALLVVSMWLVSLSAQVDTEFHSRIGAGRWIANGAVRRP
jgi:cobalamin synthase